MSANDQRCERCGLMRPNCGPWREDGQRFALICGPCKNAATFTPQRRARLDLLLTSLAIEVARQEKAEAIIAVGVEVDATALPPGAPERDHPAGTGACPEDEPCGACAAAYAEPDERDDEETAQ